VESNKFNFFSRLPFFAEYPTAFLTEGAGSNIRINEERPQPDILECDIIGSMAPLLVLQCCKELGNLGTLLRSAVAFGSERNMWLTMCVPGTAITLVSGTIGPGITGHGDL